MYVLVPREEVCVKTPHIGGVNLWKGELKVSGCGCHIFGRRKTVLAPTEPGVICILEHERGMHAMYCLGGSGVCILYHRAVYTKPTRVRAAVVIHAKGGRVAAVATGCCGLCGLNYSYKVSIFSLDHRFCAAYR
jgi:hypothetical protein